jgi:hypothetical protein
MSSVPETPQDRQGKNPMDTSSDSKSAKDSAVEQQGLSRSIAAPAQRLAIPEFPNVRVPDVPCKDFASLLLFPLRFFDELVCLSLISVSVCVSVTQLRKLPCVRRKERSLTFRLLLPLEGLFARKSLRTTGPTSSTMTRNQRTAKQSTVSEKMCKPCRRP